MGRAKRKQPKRLSEKLLKIRNYRPITQTEMLSHVSTGDKGDHSLISKYESGKLTPSILEVFNYSNYANLLTDKTINVEHLIDDEKDLPF